MKDRFCHACTAPLSVPKMRGKAKDYCVLCTDEDGKLLPKEQVAAGIAHWFRSWQGNISEEVALARAKHFMKAMPAWANDGPKKAKKK